MRSADKGEEGREHLLYLSRSGGVGEGPRMGPDSFVVRHQGSEKPEEKGMDIMGEHLGRPQEKLLVINDKMGPPVEPEQVRSGAYGHED